MMDALKGGAENLIAGDGRDSKVSLGPVISSVACERIHESIESGLKEGAELLVDGRRPAGVPAGGNFVGPTILNNVKPEMRVARREIFGPVLSPMYVDAPEHARGPGHGESVGHVHSVFPS